MSEEIVLPIPNLELPQHHFTLTKPNLKHLHEAAHNALLAGIEKDNMAPYYKALTSCASPVITLDQSFLDTLLKSNEEELKKLDERLQEAEKTEGEMEISDALKARALFFTRIGDKDKAIAAHELALEKTPGVGSKIDVTLALIRIGFFFNDDALIVKNLARAEEFIEKGGDWDRRNRLKVYRGLHLTTIRKFKDASELFIDALSTFTATELIGYNDFVALTVIMGVFALKRPDLKKKIIAAPEVMQVLPEIPLLSELTGSLYDCQYAKFFVALATLEQSHLIPSRVLNPHARYYVREMRIIAYTQLLQSYRSLTLKSMSLAFGVTEEFMDRELGRFISQTRLNCTIDKVHGIVETNRPEAKIKQYEDVLKKGDLLLNSVQRLSKVLY